MTLSERLRELVRRCKEDGIKIRFTDILEAASMLESKWRPIETAPKDGSPVLGCSHGPWPDCHSEGLHPTTVRWRSYHPNQPGKKQWRDRYGNPVFPTHWQPVVAPEVPE